MVFLVFPLAIAALFFASAANAEGWVYMERDNTSSVDALNLLGCFYNSGSTNDTIVLRDDQTGGLAIYNNFTEINTDDYDAGLGPCYTKFGNRLSFTAYRYSYFPTDVTNFGTLIEVLMSGELGFEPTRQRVDDRADRFNATGGIIGNTTLQARAKYASHYEMYMSLDNDETCWNNDKFATVSDLCQDDKMVAFRSYKVYNPEANRALITNVWPHHRCEKGDYHTDYVGPRGWSSCKARTVYSWYGTFDGDECHKHESASVCDQWEVDEWGGNFVSGGSQVGGYPVVGGIRFQQGWNYDYPRINVT